jgi:signal transduction histidine kinase
MEFDEIQVIVIFSSIVLFTVLGITITLFYLFQKKKLAFILREKEQEKQFEETLKHSQIEIQENALKNIAWELHDNVGQLLSLARLELNILQPKSENNADKILEVSNIIGDSLQEIRAISKTLNAEVINNIGLVESIQIEIDRFKRLNFIQTKFEIEGEVYDISQKDEIILFRMIQEFFSNTIKHSKATVLEIKLEFLPNHLKIFVKDNGQGFDITKAKKGSGLLNLKSRATMINTLLDYDSGKDGTQMKLTYPTGNKL